MSVRYVIGPSIGIARVGNSPTDFYLAPEAIGGRPVECDVQGNPILKDGQPVPVSQYKDGDGRVKRQAARFMVFAVEDDGAAREVTLDDPDVLAIRWTAHLANKKAAWYNFQELDGNLLLGPDNSYEKKGVPLRNASQTTREKRQKLIIDPGPRALSGANQKTSFSKETVPPDYPFASFPDTPSQGSAITTLGDMMTDGAGRLLVLGGFGRAGGNEPITTFAGADTWHDDISDGPITCEITFKNGDTRTLQAWCLVGSPKFVPEVVNIVTMDDLMFDVAVRCFDLIPDLCKRGTFNTDYVANYDRDIAPILQRPAAYRWVAAIPMLNSFSPPPFDPKDASGATAEYRKAYFSLFRNPGENGFTDGQQQQLFDPASGIPMMPMNSGTNSVSNDELSKFLTLTRTQYFLLGQWAAGKFTTEPPTSLDGVLPLDRASVGNCVGGPLCPGIESTWSLYSPEIYEAPFHIRHRHDATWYQQHGLDPMENETLHLEQGPNGCEPGDLTKRMAIPWQADFFQCTIQFVNFTDPAVNKDPEMGIPLPPTYYAYWWPPQSPWNVMTGDLTVEGQRLAGTPAGLSVNYARGVNSFSEMITAWSYLGFVTNQAEGPYRDLFPNFVETERGHDKFVAASVAVGSAQDVVTGSDTNFVNAWYLAPDPARKPVDARRAIPKRGHLAR